MGCSRGQWDKYRVSPGDGDTRMHPRVLVGEGGHWDGHGVLQGTVRQAPGDKEVAAVPGPA